DRVAAAVALEVQKIYAEIDIVGHAKRLGAVLQSALGRLAAHPLVGDVEGVGLILGMELMRDGESRIPFDAALNVGARVEAAAKHHGLLLRVVGDRLVFAPPLVIETAEIEDVSARLERPLEYLGADLKREAVWPCPLTPPEGTPDGRRLPLTAAARVAKGESAIYRAGFSPPTGETQ